MKTVRLVLALLALTLIAPWQSARAADVICYNCPPEWADWASMLKAIKADLNYDIPHDNKNSGQALAQILAEKSNPVGDIGYFGVTFGMKAKAQDALEPYKPTWYEDPIRMNSPQALAEYARSTDVWVCASETLGSRFPYKDMLDRDAMHVVMADLCWTGGLTEGRKIAAMAETYHRPFAPHDCIGPIGFIAAIHMSFSQPNTLIQESVRAFYKGWYNELVTTMPVIKDGFVYPMEGPGLGVDLLPAVFDRSDLTVRRSNV